MEKHQMSSWSVVLILMIVLGFLLGFLNSQGETQVTLSPSDFQEIQIQPGGILTISLSGFSPEISFGVIQANAYLLNITISYNRTLSPGFFNTGINTGLVVYKMGTPSASVYLRNPNLNETVQVLLGFHVYGPDAPIPGGCNLEESIQTAPFLPTSFTKSLLTVMYPLGSWPLNVRPATCDRYPLEYDIYHYYLPERDVSAQTLFASLRLMSDVNAIQTNGRKVQYFGTPPNQIKFANYVGTGRIVAVVARSLTDSAAYVPTVSYGCSPGFSDLTHDSCALMATPIIQILSAFMIFVGLFLTILGHRFYKSQLFVKGFCLTGIVSYVILIALLQVPNTVATAVAITLGAVGGALLLLLWAKWGAPVLPIFLACLLLGALFGSIMAYTPLADYAIFKDSTTFWLAFITLVLIGPLIFFSFARMASIVFTTFVGSYIFIVAVDQFTGSNLKFIIINMERRVTVSGFGMSIVDPPFQPTDFILTVLWAILAVGGTFFQVWREKGRAPFPAPPTWPLRQRRPTTMEEAHAVDESSPLLSQ